MGPLSRLIAHAVEHVRNLSLIQTIVHNLLSFSRSAVIGWRQNKLSEIDPSEETLFLENEALTETIPSLWRLLRGALFATVIVFRSVIARILSEEALARDEGMTCFEAVQAVANDAKLRRRLPSILWTPCGICSSYPREWDIAISRSIPLCT